jgi:CrcB protein
VAALKAIGMNLGILLAVALGGALGSLLRYGVASAIQTPAAAGFPWGIFVVNVTGGFLMGVIVELGALKLSLAPELRAFLTVGILGGYTTFSTFSLDSVLLLQRGAYASAALYIVGSTMLSIAALFGGLTLVRAL